MTKKEGMSGVKSMKEIAGELAFNHSREVQFRFNDIDTLGHLNNSVYFQLYDLGKAYYFNTIKSENIDWSKADIVVANVNCDFCAPIFFDENIHVQTKILNIFDKSFKLIQQLINIETGEVKSVCVTIMVGYDIKSKRAKSITDEWRNALSKYEGVEL